MKTLMLVGLLVLTLSVGVSVYLRSQTHVAVTVMPGAPSLDEATRRMLEEGSQTIDTETEPQGRLPKLSE